jgi:hypothetical protein
LVRASDCGSEGRRFESGYLPGTKNPAISGVFAFLDSFIFLVLVTWSGILVGNFSGLNYGFSALLTGKMLKSLSCPAINSLAWCWRHFYIVSQVKYKPALTVNLQHSTQGEVDQVQNSGRTNSGTGGGRNAQPESHRIEQEVFQVSPSTFRLRST